MANDQTLPAPAAARRLGGVIPAVLTPFGADLAPDGARLVRLCRWLLSRGADALAVFGTTGEGNSLTVGEREELIAALVDASIDPALLLPGTGCCALPDTVRLTRFAARAGCGGALVLPPFFYKDLGPEGLYRSFAEVIERVGEKSLRLYLYHFPQVAHVPLPIAVIERLKAAYPATVAGMKDSSGDWAGAQAVLSALGGARAPEDRFDFFVGREGLCLANLRQGGAGSITAVANLFSPAMAALHREFRSPGAEELQAQLDSAAAPLRGLPLTPALKALVARAFEDPGFRTVRPPLEELPPAAEAQLLPAWPRGASGPPPGP